MSRRQPHVSGAVRPKRRRWLVVAGALALAVAAWVWGPRLVAAPPAPAPTNTERGPATLDAVGAYREGVRYYAAGRYVEAVPYFRRVGELTPGAPREYHMQFVEVLTRASQQARSDHAQPASRSSVERVAMMNEALAHLERARQLSTTAREAAQVHVERANAWRVWGFPWEGLLELRAAANADPQWREVAEAGDLVARRLREPTLPLPGLETDLAVTK